MLEVIKTLVLLNIRTQTTLRTHKLALTAPEIIKIEQAQMITRIGHKHLEKLIKIWEGNTLGKAMNPMEIS